MKNKNSILVLGYFGYETNQLDGQTVKTRTVYRLLNEESSGSVFYFDTQQLKKNKAAVFSLLDLIIKSSRIVYLPARKNLTFIFPILFLICFITGKSISYFVIGGWLPAFAGRNLFHKKLLQRIRNIFVETHAMEKTLNVELGFKNVAIFPNFRFHGFIPAPIVTHSKFRMVFMSRITKLKGVDVIFRMAELLKSQSKDSSVVIDFYGPLNPPEKEWFFNELDRFNDFVAYHGALQPEQIFETLSNYDVMLFPTRYPGEGCPGAVIDAYISGIPVIASDWKYNSEFVEHNVSGLIFLPEKETDFYGFILELIDNSSKLTALKDGASKKSREFSQEIAKEILVQHKII